MNEENFTLVTNLILHLKYIILRLAYLGLKPGFPRLIDLSLCYDIIDMNVMVLIIAQIIQMLKISDRH